MSALSAIVELRKQLDELERAAIQSAREKGASLEDIGEALGITRQALQQRLRAHAGDATSTGPSPRARRRS